MKKTDFTGLKCPLPVLKAKRVIKKMKQGESHQFISDDPGSPIFGMPIIMAHKAKNVIVMKRGMGKGYAGIENSLFFNENTRMLFGNAKDSLQSLVNEIKSL